MTAHRLPDAWRLGRENVEGDFEAWRIAGDGHRFEGAAIQGTEEQCVSAARILELHRTGSKVLPLVRKPPRERVAA